MHIMEGQIKVQVLINKPRGFPNQTAGGTKHPTRAEMFKHFVTEMSYLYQKRQNSLSLALVAQKVKIFLTLGIRK